MTHGEEFQTRHRYTDDVLAYFKAQPMRWIDAHELAIIGGFCGWRTRISDARKIVQGDGADIEWNKQARHSAYRYVPNGRDAGEVIEQPSLDLR